ncbi:integrase [Rhodoligotrophos appendicifer]|uniref:site-specific integrase n=1 Tax=Rhodoligotrophos appendicifer TaxID=987056 RepID=UPI001184C8E3|nr:site-specific integrase [Rhodoligotrophos appendicifer]
MSATSRYETLPSEEWPRADRDGWEAACSPAHRLKSGGRAGHLKISTRGYLQRGYGYLLDFCARNGTFNVNAPAAAHVTPANVEAFLSELDHRVESVARYNYINRIRTVARFLVPGDAFEWLHEIELDLKDKMRPRAKAPRIVDGDRLLRLGLDLMAEAETAAPQTELTRARTYRNGLMIAFLTLCPIRLKNLAGLCLGEHLQRSDDGWYLVLNASETKNGRPDERIVPTLIAPQIDRWIAYWRNLFLNPGDAMWASVKGGALAYTYVGEIITQVTKERLGKAVNPHLFRDCAVHTIADLAGTKMGLASALLQHTDPRVTEKHYNKGSRRHASAHFAELIARKMVLD